jgi:thiol:disulfide interchange protein
MKKNIIIILAIFLVPLALYWGLTRDRLSTPPSVAAQGAEVIKFASPMCYECQELEKVFEEVFPNYADKISLRKIDVTRNDDTAKTLIKQYNVTLVPTTVFKKSDGTVVRRIEGCIKNEILENYLKEIIDG